MSDGWADRQTGGGVTWHPVLSLGQGYLQYQFTWSWLVSWSVLSRLFCMNKYVTTGHRWLVWSQCFPRKQYLYRDGSLSPFRHCIYYKPGFGRSCIWDIRQWATPSSIDQLVEIAGLWFETNQWDSSYERLTKGKLHIPLCPVGADRLVGQPYSPRLALIVSLQLWNIRVEKTRGMPFDIGSMILLCCLWFWYIFFYI